MQQSGESRRLVTERLVHEKCSRVTLDYDGSVLSTGRHAEGTAVGFNKKKKGARSYYPLFCTIAQTDQVLDVHHRPGNVHDSNGADAFIDHCVSHVRSCLPRAKVETRIDSAFFNETITQRLHSLGVAFTISVPFERFADLKGLVEGRKRWRRMAVGLDYFETRWKPKSWNAHHRFIFIRKQVRCQSKLPIQLDLFHPTEYGYEFKVIVTNQRMSRARSLHSTKAAARRRASSPSSRRIARWITYRSRPESATNCTCSPAFSLTTSLVSYRSNSTLAPVARPQSVPRCGASGRLGPFVVPSSNVPGA